MEINEIPDKIWHDLISRKIVCDFKFMALRVLLTKLSISAETDSSPESYSRYTKDLISFFENNNYIPSLQSDYQTLLKKAGLK